MLPLPSIAKAAERSANRSRIEHVSKRKIWAQATSTSFQVANLNTLLTVEGFSLQKPSTTHVRDELHFVCQSFASESKESFDHDRKPFIDRHLNQSAACLGRPLTSQFQIVNTGIYQKQLCTVSREARGDSNTCPKSWHDASASAATLTSCHPHQASSLVAQSRRP